MFPLSHSSLFFTLVTGTHAQVQTGFWWYTVTIRRNHRKIALYFYKHFLFLTVSEDVVFVRVFPGFLKNRVPNANITILSFFVCVFVDVPTNTSKHAL